MGGNDGLLASLERAVEIRGNNDIVGDETSRIECIAELVREIDQHEACANFLGDLLDLSKAVHRRSIDARDQAEIEHEEPAVWLIRKQRLDLLIKPIGGAEE